MNINTKSQRSEVVENIKEINKLFHKLSTQEISQFLKDLNNVIFFYGFTEEIFLEIIKEKKIPYSYPDNKLSELRELTDSVLFQLKHIEGNEYFESVA